MKKDRKEFLTCFTGAISNNKLYVVHEILGTLMEYDLSDFSYRILAKIDLKVPQKRIEIKGMVIVEDVIYFTLLNSWNVIEYHLKTNQFKINGEDTQYIEGKRAIEAMYLYKNKLWLMPYYAGEKVRIFDLETKQYRIQQIVGSCLDENEKRTTEKNYVDYELSQDGMIYAIIYNSKYLVAINMSSEKYTLQNLGDTRKFSGINYDGKNYWISDYTNKIIKWNPKDGVLEEHFINALNRDEKREQIRLIYEKNDEICIIPTYTPYMIILNKKSREIVLKKYHDNIGRIHQNENRYFFYSGLVYKDKIILLPLSSNKLVILSKDFEIAQVIDNRLNKLDIEKYILKKGGEAEPIEELYGWGIKEFIEILVDS